MGLLLPLFSPPFVLKMVDDGRVVNRGCEFKPTVCGDVFQFPATIIDDSKLVIGGQINLCWCCDGLARLSGIYCTSCLAIASCDPSWMLLAVRKRMDVAPSPFPCRFFFFPFPCLPSTACSSLTSQRTFISIHLKEQKHFLDLAPCGGLVD